MPIHETIRHGKTVTGIRVNIDKTEKDRGERVYWHLLRSDAHHDNPHCDREMEARHLKQAVERNASISDHGDLFCAMQGKWDKRSSKDTILPEHQCGDYLDALVRTAADFYQPYAHHFAVMGLGNHETSISKKHETDLSGRLVATLNDRTGSNINAGGYTNWINFQFYSASRRFALRLWATHGYGGGGPVTQDMIQATRQREYVEGADIMALGHTHDAWCSERTKIRLSKDGHRQETRPLWQVKLGTYKDEYGEGAGGWATERGIPPKPKGAWWLRIVLHPENGVLSYCPEAAR